MAGKKSPRQAITPLDREAAMNDLREKIAGARSELKHLTVENGAPHSRVSLAERAKMIRLHQKGVSALDISRVTDRDRRTVLSVILRYRNSLTKT